MVWNSQDYKLKYWATRSSVRTITLTAHLFACSTLLTSLARWAALARFLARSLVAHWMISWLFILWFFCFLFRTIVLSQFPSNPWSTSVCFRMVSRLKSTTNTTAKSRMAASTIYSCGTRLPQTRAFMSAWPRTNAAARAATAPSEWLVTAAHGKCMMAAAFLTWHDIT